MVSFDDVLQAREAIAGQVRQTPMFSATTLGQMAPTPVALFLKGEIFQKTGSFKPRGVLYRLSRLNFDGPMRFMATFVRCTKAMRSYLRSLTNSGMR